METDDRKLELQLYAMQRSAFDYRLSRLDENDKDFAIHLASVIWNIAEPDPAIIKKYLRDVPDDSNILQNFRFLSVYPVFPSDGFKLCRDPRIVFRTESLASGETTAALYIVPPYRDKNSSSKDFAKKHPHPLHHSDLTDPIILGSLYELDQFRHQDGSPLKPIQELSICCGLFDGITIQQITDAPVWVYRGLPTILESTLVPVERLNVWVRRKAILDEETIDLNYEQIAKKIKDAFSNLCDVLEIAFYDEAPRKAEWYNQLTLNETRS